MEKMNQLSCELLHYIFHYIDQLPDLIRATLVCHHWRSSIMKDEHFLNLWFARSLKRSRMSALRGSRPENNGNQQQQQQLRPSLDLPLFPIGLESSECWLLPIIDPFHLCASPHVFKHKFPPSLFQGFHTFSFWLFLPRDCELAVRIGYYNILGLSTSFPNDRQSNYANKQTLPGDRWLHVVLANLESHNRYRIWINGEDSKGFNLPHSWHQCHIESTSEHTIYLSCKRINYSIQSPIESRVADLVAFKRCLSTTEIRAIHEQQTSIDHVRIGTYIKTTAESRSRSSYPVPMRRTFNRS